MCQTEKNLDKSIGLLVERIFKKKYNMSEEIKLSYSDEKFGIQVFERCLRHENIELKDRSVVILGMGDLAKKAATICLEEKVSEIYIINRTFINGEKFCNTIEAKKDREKIKLISVENYNALPEKRYIFLQCASLEENHTIINDLDFYKKIKIGIEFEYKYKTTGFIKNANTVGRKVIQGLKVYICGFIVEFEKRYDIQVSDKDIEDIYFEIFKELGYEE